MLDLWEYLFFVVWDSVFYCIFFVMIDFDFVKKQFDFFICEWYCYLNGQFFVQVFKEFFCYSRKVDYNRYEWNFGDVNLLVYVWVMF